MHKSLLCLALLFTTIGSASANGLVPGQHHLLPDSQDRQHITLIGKKTDECGNGMGLFLVDEWGSVAATAFKVPTQTVFLLTDVSYLGYSPASYKGIPTLSISTGAGDANRAVFTTTALAGTAQEQFAGSAALTTGVAYPVNTTFCAYASAAWSNGGATLNLNRVTVQGSVVTNYETSGLTW